jgi:hypothetical protein
MGIWHPRLRLASRYRLAQEPEAAPDPQRIEEAADAIVDLSNSLVKTLPLQKQLDDPIDLFDPVVKKLDATGDESLMHLADEIGQLYKLLKQEKKDLDQWYVEFFDMVKNHPGFALLGLREKG